MAGITRYNRVLHLTHLGHNSAITEYMVQMFHVLKNRKDQFFVFSQAKSSFDRLRREGVSKSKCAVGTSRKLKSLVFKKFGHVCVYGGSDFCLAIFIKLVFFKKYKIVRIRGENIFGRTSAKMWGLNLLERYVDVTLVPSQFLLNEFTRLGLDTANMRVVPLGLDDAQFYPTTSENANQDILIVGRFDPKKGYSYAFRCFVELKKKLALSGLRLVVVGKPTKISYEQLCRLITDVGLEVGSDVVVHSGHMENIAELMRNATVGWISSVASEYVARVGYEFLLSGVPIFVNSVSSLPETVCFDEAGKTYDHRQDTIGEVADKLRRLFEKASAEPLAQRIARANAAKGYFSRNRMRKDIETIIQ